MMLFDVKAGRVLRQEDMPIEAILRWIKVGIIDRMTFCVKELAMPKQRIK